jgi:hypothetical protein
VCGAAIVAGAIALENTPSAGICGWSTVGLGGYAYAYQDSGGSTACVDATAFCGEGTTVAQGIASYTTTWGAGIGISIDQALFSDLEGVVVPTSAGLSYAVSNIPMNGLRINLKTPAFPLTSEPCAQITETTGTIPWNSFSTTCWTEASDAGVFSPSDGITDIQFQVMTTPEESSWDFCVTSLSF